MSRGIRDKIGPEECRWLDLGWESGLKEFGEWGNAVLPVHISLLH